MNVVQILGPGDGN